MPHPRSCPLISQLTHVSCHQDLADSGILRLELSVSTANVTPNRIQDTAIVVAFRLRNGRARGVREGFRDVVELLRPHFTISFHDNRSFHRRAIPAEAATAPHPEAQQCVPQQRHEPVAYQVTNTLAFNTSILHTYIVTSISLLPEIVFRLGLGRPPARGPTRASGLIRSF